MGHNLFPVNHNTTVDMWEKKAMPDLTLLLVAPANLSNLSENLLKAL